MAALFRWLHAECGIKNESDWIGHEVAFNNDMLLHWEIEACTVAYCAGKYIRSQEDCWGGARGEL